MGQTLSSPDTEKHSKSGGDERFVYGVCEMQGWRISMEDAHAIELELEDNRGGHNSFFAVYDGHGGGTVAKYSGENVHKRLVKEDSYVNQQWDSALKGAFLGTDEDIRAESRFFRDPSGCTAVAALITQNGRIFVANAGDSRSVISVKGEVKPLSFDHKPLNESEMTRIRNAGGYVEYGRVNGNLALSRAIGDFEFKKNFSLSPEEQIITANPDITEHKITEEDEFLVLACDGIWDCLTSQQVVDIIRLQVSQRKELSEIAEFICDHCLAPDTTSGAGVGCDNMTVLIIALLNGRTKEQWYDWMEDRVKRKYGYPTPEEVPQLYAPSRINAFRARRQAYEERARDRANSGDSGSDSGSDSGFAGVFGGRGMGPAGGLGGFARSMLGAGITFHPSTGIAPDDGTLMFTNDDSDDDSEDDVEMTGPGSSQSPFDDAMQERRFLSALGLRPPQSDVTKSLKAQLDELEDSDDVTAGPRIEEVDDTTPGREPDEDQAMSNPGDEAQQAFGAQPPNLTNGISTKASGEAPPPPAPLVNGDIKVKQLSSLPGGDEASPVVKAEGLMDGSESPIKG
ncbi:PP2C-domain-containing protein [Fomitiporia mediterranea MF3/22]|uniref:PP2C-domain-containing protein n=1 Tax=Fomitiporia mediterranea (strain MF3/22) TaxID=694068 RepID=UPI0004409438|nr:PP2C-domain-containing protein [Fomitiporia mediterranea MF3/22]EJC98112.1 PP2C-domain-containing protein [Fomitiporia mediterranea MF3/22]